MFLEAGKGSDIFLLLLYVDTASVYVKQDMKKMVSGSFILRQYAHCYWIINTDNSSTAVLYWEG